MSHKYPNCFSIVKISVWVKILNLSIRVSYDIVALTKVLDIVATRNKKLDGKKQKSCLKKTSRKQNKRNK